MTRTTPTGGATASNAEERFQQQLREGLLAAGITPSKSLDGFSFDAGPTLAEKRTESRTIQRRVAFSAMVVLLPAAALLSIGLWLDLLDEDYLSVVAVAGFFGFMGFSVWFFFLIASRPGGIHYPDRVAAEGARAAALLREERHPSKRGF